MIPFTCLTGTIQQGLVLVHEKSNSEDEQSCRECVQFGVMSDSKFSIEFIGGSRDGDVILASNAPEHLEVKVGSGWNEVYERQNDQPPFVYVQIGYAEKEQWS